MDDEWRETHVVYMFRANMNMEGRVLEAGVVVNVRARKFSHVGRD